jgi:hypothetical protein
LKNDRRSMERSTKTKKNGKKGGMTGGKQRSHHKYIVILLYKYDIFILIACLFFY